MKEFIVCYTSEERIMKKADISKEQVIQELVEKIEQNKYFLTKVNMGIIRLIVPQSVKQEFMKKMTRNLFTLNYNIDTGFLFNNNFNYLYMGENMNV